jgi:hypothetical protein
VVPAEDYSVVDACGDGAVDTLTLCDAWLPQINEKGVLEVDLVVDEDELAPRKNRIIRFSGLVVLALLLANFILSYVKLGNPTFWIQ